MPVLTLTSVYTYMSTIDIRTHTMDHHTVLGPDVFLKEYCLIN